MGCGTSGVQAEGRVSGAGAIHVHQLEPGRGQAVGEHPGHALHELVAELVVGLASGGLLPARVVADELALPLAVLTVRRGVFHPEAATEPAGSVLELDAPSDLPSPSRQFRDFVTAADSDVDIADFAEFQLFFIGP